MWNLLPISTSLVLLFFSAKKKPSLNIFKRYMRLKNDTRKFMIIWLKKQPTSCDDLRRDVILIARNLRSLLPSIATRKKPMRNSFVFQILNRKKVIQSLIIQITEAILKRWSAQYPSLLLQHLFRTSKVESESECEKRFFNLIPCSASEWYELL